MKTMDLEGRGVSLPPTSIECARVFVRPDPDKPGEFFTLAAVDLNVVRDLRGWAEVLYTMATSIGLGVERALAERGISLPREAIERQLKLDLDDIWSRAGVSVLTREVKREGE